MTKVERDLLELTRRAGSERVALAHIEQRKVKQISDRLENCHVEGMGQKVATIHWKFFENLCQKYGPAWFRDRDCLRDTLRRHPFLRVNSRSAKIFITVPDKSGLRAGAGRGARGDPAPAVSPATGKALATAPDRGCLGSMNQPAPAPKPPRMDDEPGARRLILPPGFCPDARTA